MARTRITTGIAAGLLAVGGITAGTACQSGPPQPPSPPDGYSYEELHEYSQEQQRYGREVRQYCQDNPDESIQMESLVEGMPPAPCSVLKNYQPGAPLPPPNSPPTPVNPDYGGRPSSGEEQQKWLCEQGLVPPEHAELLAAPFER